MVALLYVLLSASLFILAMSVSWFSVIGVCSFLIPLFYIPRTVWWHGMVWGFVVFGFHTSWILCMMHERDCFVWYGYLVWGMLLLWLSLSSSAWLYFFRKKPIISTTIFFIFLYKYCLCIFGTVDGYPLINPLILLVDFPSIFSLVYWFGDVGYLFLLFSVQWLIFWLCRDRIWLIILFFITLFLLQTISKKPCNVVRADKACAVVLPWWYGNKDPMFVGYRISHDIACVAQKYPDLTHIILPESSFCWNVYDYVSFHKIWCDGIEDTMILIGAHGQSGDNTHNGIFFLHKGKIVRQYFKQHSMPLLEKSLWFESYFGSMVKHDNHRLKTMHYQLKNQHDKDDLVIINNDTYQLFICSEFFFESKTVSAPLILLLWNDSWLSYVWTQRLARQFIHYFEKKYHVTVYHVSTLGYHNFSCFL